MLGTTISHYRVEQELGRGGMGTVYRAFDELLQRSVAIKLLTSDSRTQHEVRSRVLAEARAACALNHPNIMTIYEVGEHEGQLFIVMELVTGKVLRATAGAGTMDCVAVARLGIQLAEALASAHRAGVVHGDIKPENVMVLADGRIKVLDFGIARRAAESNLTRTVTALQPSDSQIAGTIAYMSPEQLRGESTDGRSDLYSLGVVLFELIAGRRPFAAAAANSLIAQILHEPAPSLASVATGVPAGMERIVSRLLQKHADDRYARAEDVKHDLVTLTRDLELGSALPAAVAGKKAVAVLPFKLLTPSPEDDFLSIALADAIVNELSSGGELLVRPVSTVARYARQGTDPLSAARELNVQVVVDGSIQKFGQKLRVHVQAWNAADGSTLLSGKHESEMADLFGLQDKIAESLSRVLGLKAAKKEEEETTGRPTRNSFAYELFLRALDRLNRQNRWDTRTAIEMLGNAVELDPQFADAWGRLAQARWIMGVSFEPGPKWLRQAEIAIRRALKLDPENSYGLCSHGLVLWTAANKFQNRAALRALAQALRRNPGCHPARVWRGCILLHVGLWEQAKEGLLSALANNPEDAFTLVFLAQAGLFSGQYEEALEYHARAFAVDRANLWANLFAPQTSLQTGNLERAEASIRSAQQVVQDPLLTACEGLLWAKRGEARKALPLLSKAVRSKKMLSHTHHMWHTAADAYVLLGKPAEALKLLRRCIAMGLPNYTGFMNDPHLAGLKNNAQYLRMMSNLKKDYELYRKEFGSG
ncbi:MAG: protein kinase [Terriglobales bacterium]